MGERWAGPGPGPLVRQLGPDPELLAGTFCRKRVLKKEMPFYKLFKLVCLEPSKKMWFDEILNFPLASCQDLSWRPHW